MIRLTLLIFMATSCQIAFAKIEGVVTRFQLLAQLQTHLEIDTLDLWPISLIQKLPITNDYDELKPSFYSAWTQISFLACQRALEKKTISFPKADTNSMKKWITTFSSQVWSAEPLPKEIEDILASATSSSQPITLACTSIFSSPKTFLIYSLERGPQ